MSKAPLQFANPFEDAISRIRFAPHSDNLLISSWDSSLRLYDVGSSVLRLEAHFEAALLDCCFQNESVAFTAGSDGSITRYDLHSAICDTIGNHDDIATCIGYSDETCQVITAGMDRKILSWDTRLVKNMCFAHLGSEVDSMSLSVFDMVIAIGASVHMYDLRKIERPFQSKKLDLGQIKCVGSYPYFKGFAVGSVDGRVAVDLSFPSDSDDIRYMFRCHPKSTDGRYHLEAVNDIAFNPLFTGAFVTGDKEGYVIAWDAQSRRKQFELPRFPNSVASLSFNQGGQLLAIASSYTYQEANEIEDLPLIFIHKIDDGNIRSVSSASSSRK
ncbi:mitotic checkpoint protein BUB3.3 [Ziziphus jujuba]|uniref:Mitotic checkpoint protein BUB3.3 n=1 Tax=Ziziphus jujuba TaxID=326968 RepID=A0A6P4AJH5_ZIZJJ|nr:mitotic checkpoint protein BUB3.3 [Ziziphus jujuba]